MTHVKRALLESTSKGRAGIIESVGNYHKVKVLNDFEMYVHRDDGSVAPCLVRDGFWESWITVWMIQNIDRDTTFYDIGANSGYYAFIASRLGAAVEAFEPNPDYANMIKATVELGGFNVPFCVNELALSNTNGSAELHIPYDMHGSASLNGIDPAYPTRSITVPLVRWDSFHSEIPTNRKRIFKIDAEGEEERILEGAQRYIRNCVPAPIIVLEYTPGSYSDEFLPNLRKDWHINWINFDAEEEPVDDNWLSNQDDWRMLVLRKK